MKKILWRLKGVFRFLENELINVMLIAIVIAGLIGFFVSDANFTYLLSILIIYIPASIYERRRFIKKILYHVAREPRMSIWELSMMLKINPRITYQPKNLTLFEKIVIYGMYIVAFVMTIMVMYVLIFNK